MQSMIILLLFAHLIGDFLLQSRIMALNKSKSLYYLCRHGIDVGGSVFIVFLIFKPFAIAVILTLIYTTVHCLQDFTIWRAAKSFFKPDEKYYETKKFYDIIGIDQFLHLAFLVFLSSF